MQGPSEIDPAQIIFDVATGQIGKGKFGTVYRGRCRECVVAVKVPCKQHLNTRDLNKFRKEVEVMSRINHPNVCLFMGACTQPGNIRIVSELMKGDLEHALKRPEQIALSTRMKWAKDAATGMAWLHANNPIVLHRDLKTCNLLMGENDIVKVCDFGLSQFQNEGQALRDSTPRGTPLYMAPEVIMRGDITPKVDVYAFGIILWEIVTRTEAFAHHSDINRFATAICRHHERPIIPTDTPASLSRLMIECWDRDPNTRPSFAEIVQRLEAIIEECTVIESNMRIESRVRDPLGREFWRRYFLGSSTVSWVDFASALCDMLMIQISPELIDAAPRPENRPLWSLRAIVAENNEVNLAQFGKALGWFGPLEAQYNEGDGFLTRAFDLLSEPWFHGPLRAEAAEQLLRTSLPGSFLVRFSSQADSYALSQMTPTGQIMHTLIRHFPGHGFQLNQEMYGSLQEIVSLKARELQLEYPIVCSTYAHIYHDGDVDVIGYSNQQQQQQQ